MKDDFFDWLNECPVQWFLKDDDENGRTYLFIDNEEEEEEDLTDCHNCGKGDCPNCRID
jgi:hypothetical protein